MRTVAATCATLALLALVACSRGQTSYSGTLQSESADVGSTVGGRVIAVLASDGEKVSKGQTIVRFDPKDQQAALVQAQGQLAQAQANLADLLAGPRQQDIEKANAQAAQAQHVYQQAQLTGPHQITEAAANLRQARAAAVQAHRDADRSRQLYAGGAISAQANDAALSAERQAQARYTAAQAQFVAAQTGSVPQSVAAAGQAYEAAAANAALVAAGTRPEQIQQARDAVRTAQGLVAGAKARLAEMVVAAPADGIINSLDLRAGDLVPAGASVATVDEFVDPFVRIYVAQASLGVLKVGQQVTVRSDAFPGRTFDGRVESIDSSAQFTPRDVQTAEDRANLVFGVKVRVHDPDRVLRGGTTASVAL
ncbi:MAG TPA: efflux RND transporter periplasmic adaptor subunit [Candidatus Eremiobacteraceae bacterium]|nr:efflux RND transporter periplasmic adaptor subunit [Candidatus Eremiobacteraceae bacterium]